MMGFYNDCQKITPIDSGITERVKYLRYLLKYSLNPIKANERKADPTLKNKFELEEYKNSLLYLMIDTYKSLNNIEKEIGGNIEDPISVKMETKEWIKDEEVLFLEKINEKFEITNDEKDSIESSKILKYIKEECNMKISDVKIGLLLNKLIKLDNSCKTIKNKRCRIGIKKIDCLLDL